MRVIAIDGPAGSGKSTVGKALATELGLEYLDTGAMYRSVTFAVLQRGLDPNEVEEVARVAEKVEITSDAGRVLVDGVDASVAIRGPEVSRAVSAVAANPAVRTELVRRQREWVAQRRGGVVEGRDIGTVVFPDAELKVYLTADPRVRAERRALEVPGTDVDAVATDLARRDAADSTRDHSPLAEASDAFVVDTSGLAVSEIVRIICERLDPDG